MGTGLKRKTLKGIPYYPTPTELYNAIITSPGWPYKRGSPSLLARDRALVALLYLGGLRVTEALRIKKGQFIAEKEYILIRGIELSKTKINGVARRIRFRDVKLPLAGERAPFTTLVMDYVHMLKDGEDRLFPWKLEKDKRGQVPGGKRAWQIVTAILPEHTCHWLRAYCEDYLYSVWDKDMLAVADYIKVNPRQLQQYIRRRHERYSPA